MVAVHQSRVRSASEELADDACLYTQGGKQPQIRSEHHLNVVSARISVQIFQTNILDSVLHINAQSRRCSQRCIWYLGSNADVEFIQMIKMSVTHEKSCPSVTPDGGEALLMSLSSDTCHSAGTLLSSLLFSID